MDRRARDRDRKTEMAVEARGRPGCDQGTDRLEGGVSERVSEV